MSNNHTPRVLRNDLENRESTLSKYRIQKGYTEQQLAELTGTSQMLINGLSTGRIAPIRFNTTGGVRPVVADLELILGVSAAKLFPAYICEIPDENAVDGQSWTGEYTNTASQDLADSFGRFHDENEKRKSLMTEIRGLPSRYKIVIVERFYGGKTLEEIGKIFNVGSERIRQMEKKAMRRLRERMSSKRSVGEGTL